MDYSFENIYQKMASFGPGYSRVHESTSRGDQNVKETLNRKKVSTGVSPTWGKKGNISEVQFLNESTT
ncbi:hypothetical protein STEG23_033879 [Scotinomys teguina]